MSNRYDDRKIFKNSNPLYKKVLKERGVTYIRHFNTPQTSHPTISQIQELNNVQHIWKTGDRFYKLAAQYYSAPQYWWLIAQYNKRPTEAHLQPGDVLYIPLPLQTVLGFYLR
mgnify:CR=1 FL=1